MNDPAILRVIRYDERKRRSAERLLIAIGLGVLVLAGILLLVAPPSNKAAGTLELWLVVFAGAVVLPSLMLIRREQRSPVYITVDEEGLIWGTDRSRDLSLPWVAIEKIRAVPDPYRESSMHEIAFLPVAGYRSPGSRGRNDIRQSSVGDYLFEIDTRLGDCPEDEFLGLIASRRPDLPIVFGSFRDPA